MASGIPGSWFDVASRKPSSWTEAEKALVIEELSGWPLAKLREHQDLYQQQIGRAHEQRNDRALENLRVMDEIVIQAIMKREFLEGD